MAKRWKTDNKDGQEYREIGFLHHAARNVNAIEIVQLALTVLQLNRMAMWFSKFMIIYIPQEKRNKCLHSHSWVLTSINTILIRQNTETTLDKPTVAYVHN